MPGKLTITYESDNLIEPVSRTAILDSDSTMMLADFVMNHPDYAKPIVDSDGNETPVELSTMAYRMIDGILNGSIANIDRYAKEKAKKEAEEKVSSVSSKITVS